MKTHTNNFKNKICLHGRELDSKITYQTNGETIELGNEQLNSVTPHYEANILKSVMKQLDVDSNVDIPIGTEINYKFGLKIHEPYDEPYTIVGSTSQEGTPTPENPSNIITKTGHITETINNEQYEFDLGDIELCKIGDHEDVIFKNETTSPYYDNTLDLDSWYIKKNVGKVVLDGTNVAFTQQSASSNNVIWMTGASYNISNNTTLLSNYFQVVNSSTAYNNDIVGAYFENSRIKCGFGLSTNLTTLELANEWLSENNVLIYYPLATPTYTKITDNTLLDQLNSVGQPYEYLNFGNYIVYSTERQEDTNSFKLVCYDKMLYMMVDYVSLGITYPITIRDYINTICTSFGLTFKNANSTFANYDKQIQQELYLDNGGNSLNYKFRDVLDELAQVTGSTICINEDDDQLEIRYITTTNDTINENYFKDINVEFGKKYGPVNSIVLSRSAETDNVYLTDEQSVAQNGLCEIKIVDNQIMNWNDRSDYLADLLSVLGGLEYYLNDYSSTGIMYYNLCDRYTAQIGENYYSCVMFNDEASITQGLYENVHTDMPKESETDYSKADKTDRKINQTYLIVDKQNQEIQSVITQTVDTGNPDSVVNKVSIISQKVDELTSQISDIADLTISGESSYATFNLARINESEPIMLKVHPTTENISYLYPRSNLYPSDTLYMPDRIIRFANTTTNENFDYVLPDDLLYYDSTHYDEFYLDYESQTCQVTKRCKYNADGTVGLLDNEVVNTYTYPTINLTEGDYTISINGYSYGYLFARLMSQNIYTSQFYTKAETNSLISQTSQSINLSVDTKLSNYSTTTEMNSAISIKANEINSTVATKVGNNEVISKINQSAEQITINANKLNLQGYITATDLSTSGSTTINGANIQTGTLSASQITTGTLNGNNVSITNLNASNIKSGTLTSRAINNGSGTFSVSTGGSIYARSGTIGGWSLASSKLYGTYNNTQYAIRPYGIDDETNSRSIGWSQVITSSDRRLKNKIKKIEDKYNRFFDDLKPVTFYFNEGIQDNKKHIGFISQDVLESQKLINEDLSMVDMPDKSKYYNLDKREIIALNTWQIQLLKKQVQEQQKQIDELKKIIKEMK